MSRQKDIAFCVNDAYAPYIGVTISSILANNASGHIDFHILTDHISRKNVRMLRDITAAYDATVHIHEVDHARLQSLELGCYTVYAWLRILLPEVLPQDVHRVLYLDSDIVVCDDLTELFERNLDGISVAAVTDYEVSEEKSYRQCDVENDGKYVCSGVLLMNLDYWREHNIAEQIITWAAAHGDIIVYPDQDSINHVCHKTLDVLPMRYGVQGAMLRFPYFYEHDPEQLAECIKQPAIVHYNSCSPWLYECQHPFIGIWDEYNDQLGRYKTRLKYRTAMSAFEQIRARIWHHIHPTDRHNIGKDALRAMMEKYGIE